MTASPPLEAPHTTVPRRAFLTGTEALAELPLLMHQRDTARGWTTGGYVSGYRGSPLAQFDRVLERRAKAFAEARIVAKAGLNEDLAATAVWGSQQSGLVPGMTVEGIFAMWYGKGPGVDRTLDVLRHANAAGTHVKGGVLALMGDDHGAVSSTLPHQTEHDMIAAMIPVLSPGGVGEYLRFGLAGWEMSRASGAWVGFKCQTELVESAATVTLDPFPWELKLPEGAGTLNARPSEPPLVLEARMEERLRLAQAFARLNGLDREAGASGPARLGIVAGGKGWLDLQEALALLGLDAAALDRHGIALRKPGLVWPLEPEGMRAFARRCETLLVVEEKRPLIEDQIRVLAYGLTERPRILGKAGADGAPLLPATGELGPLSVARALLAALPADVAALLRPLPEAPAPAPVPALKREPYFCAGCPHATSTRLPDGSRATTGIGCHMMMIDAPGRHTSTFTQMGGEGVSWLGLSPFSDERHIFVNMGDGTWFHSGALAIRAAIAAKVNATYKILFNDAVAMTGGQPHDGILDVPKIAAQVLAEGAARVAVVAETPARLKGKLPAGVSLDHRDHLDRVQRELRETGGVTVLIFDQVCAAEKRRRRKTGDHPAAPVRAVINEAVCEGCGDCAVQSGCIALEPVETPMGPKRQINQSACNVDLSCLKGFCPSFVTLENARPAKPKGAGTAPEGLALPQVPAMGDAPFNIVLGGIGGTGVITVSTLLSRAAHLDGLAVVSLDQTGLAQKNGAVVSHIRLARSETALHAPRVPPAMADLVLGFDMVTTGSPKVRPMLAAGRTHLVLDDHLTPTAEVARSALGPQGTALEIAALRDAVGDAGLSLVAATDLATAATGDAIATNMLLLGHAWQKGKLPIRLEALEKAFDGLGHAAALSRTAFAWGRLSALDAAAAAERAGLLRAQPAGPKPLDAVIAHGMAHMTGWGGARAARRWRKLVDRAQAAEAGLGGERLTRAVAATGLRLLAYKDEYEVARLHRDAGFTASLDSGFEGTTKRRYHLAPPLLPLGKDARTGRPRKIALGRSAELAFDLLLRLRGLRGTPLDLFGYTAERRAERRLARDYADLVDELCDGLTAQNLSTRVRVAELGQMVRGFGPVKEAAIRRYEDALAKMRAEM